MRGLLILWLVLGGAEVGAQTTLRLPLPVESPAEALAFEAGSPTAGVLTGFLLPSSGPLTAWAPVWSTLEPDGSLKEAQTGTWIGPRPEKWLKVVKRGSVVGGFRALLKMGAGVRTQQIQVFWLPWAEGPAQGSETSGVYGQAAGPQDQVKIIELRLPSGTIPSGLYGETVKGVVVQVSLLVKPWTSQTTPEPSANASGPQPRFEVPLPSGPAMPSVPGP